MNTASLRASNLIKLWLIFGLLGGWCGGSLKSQTVPEKSNPFWRTNSNAQASFERAVEKYRRRDLAGAFADFNKALEIVPLHIEALYGRGHVLQERGELGVAIDDYTKVLKFVPNWGDVYASRGSALAMQGKFSMAVRDCDKAVELLSTNSSVYLLRGQAKSAAGDLDGALRDFTKIIQSSPCYAEAFLGLGILKTRKGELSAALSDLNKSIECKPDFYNAYVSRAILRTHMVDVEGAQADYSTAIRLDPKQYQPICGRGCNYDAIHKFEEALNDFRIACSLDTSNYYSRLRLFLVQRWLGRKEAAVKELMDFLNSRNGKSREIWPTRLGRFLLGQTSEQEILAAAADQNKTKESEHLCEAYFYVGALRWIEGDKAAAVDFYKKCIATNQKDFSEFQSAKISLKKLLGVSD